MLFPRRRSEKVAPERQQARRQFNVANYQVSGVLSSPSRLWRVCRCQRRAEICNHFSCLRVLVAKLMRLNRYDTTISKYFYTFLKADFGKKQ